MPEKVDAFLKEADEAICVTSGQKAVDDQKRWEQEKAECDKWQTKMREAAEQYKEHPAAKKWLAAVHLAEVDLNNSGVQIRNPDSGAVTVEALPYWLKLEEARKYYWQMVASIAGIKFEESYLRGSFDDKV